MPATLTKPLASRRENTPKDWYKPGKSIREFHNSSALIRVLIGGRGSGKTTGCAVEAIRHCLNFAGAIEKINEKIEQGLPEEGDGSEQLTLETSDARNPN